MDKIVLVGFKGSGKNTVGEYLLEKYGYHGFSFADALKDTVSSIFCWDRQALEGSTPESRVWRETVDPWWANKLDIPGFTPRWALMNFGTDILRNHFHPDIWVLNVQRRLEQFENERVVVFDGRFPNEIDAVCDNGGISIRVKRGPEPTWWDFAQKFNSETKEYQENNRKFIDFFAHPSEYAWIGHHIDLTIENNSTVEDLHFKIDVLMNSV